MSLRNIQLAKLFLLSSFFPVVSHCQTTNGTVFGIGIGTFIIIISIIFSVVWCLACRSSSKPQVYSIIGILIPAILVIIFIFLPKQVDRPATTEISDSNFIPHVLFLVVSIIGLLLAMIFLVTNYLFTYKKAKNIARAAFTVKDDEQQRLNTHTTGAQGKAGQLLRNKKQGSSILGNSRSGSHITEH